VPIAPSLFPQDVRGENLSILFGLGTALGLGLLSVGPLARLSGFDPIDNFFRVVSSEFPKRREPEMGLNGL